MYESSCFGELSVCRCRALSGIIQPFSCWFLYTCLLDCLKGHTAGFERCWPVEHKFHMFTSLLTVFFFKDSPSVWWQFWLTYSETWFITVKIRIFGHHFWRVQGAATSEIWELAAEQETFKSFSQRTCLLFFCQGFHFFFFFLDFNCAAFVIFSAQSVPKCDNDGPTSANEIPGPHDVVKLLPKSVRTREKKTCFPSVFFQWRNILQLWYNRCIDYNLFSSCHCCSLSMKPACSSCCIMSFVFYREVRSS